MENSEDRVLVIGSPVITLGQDAVIPNGALIVEGNKITDAGPKAELELRGPFSRVIGSEDHIVLPGFTNSHIHSGIFNEDEFIQYPVERAMPYYLPHSLTQEENYHRTILRMAACVRGGQTQILDFAYGNPELDLFGFETTLQAYQDLGLRVSFSIAIRDRNRFVHCSDEKFLSTLPVDLREQVVSLGVGDLGDVDALFNAFKKLHADWHNPENGVVVQLGPDWIPCTSDELFLECRKVANEYGVGLSTHTCESSREMVFSLENDGKTSMRRLADLGILGSDVSFAHFVWATDEDIRILADTGGIAIHNAAANLRTGNGITRVREILDAGGRVAFGTDASSFSNTEDFFQELRLADLLQRVTGDLVSGRIPALELLRSAVQNGADASGFGNILGSLTPGNQADLIVLDSKRIKKSMTEHLTRPPYAQEITPATVIDYANAGDIEIVLIGGRVVLEDDRIQLVDVEKSRDYLEGLHRTREETGVDIAQRIDPYLMDFYGRMTKPELTPSTTFNIKDITIHG